MGGESEERRRDSPWMNPPETAEYLGIALVLQRQVVPA